MKSLDCGNCYVLWTAILHSSKMFAVKIAEERQEPARQLLTHTALFVLACARINASWKLREKADSKQP